MFKSCVFFTFISWMSCIFVLIPSMSVDAFYQSCHLKRLLYGLQLLQPNSLQAKGLEDGGIYQLVAHFLELLLSPLRGWLNKLNAGYLCRLCSPARLEKDHLSINGYDVIFKFHGNHVDWFQGNITSAIVWMPFQKDAGTTQFKVVKSDSEAFQKLPEVKLDLSHEFSLLNILECFLDCGVVSSSCGCKRFFTMSLQVCQGSCPQVSSCFVAGFLIPSGFLSTSGGMFANMLLVMMATTTIFITSEEFKLFHNIDRRLYTHLTKDLYRDPVESMRVMALWLWLERSSCFTRIIKRILSLPLILINELADEAVTCLNCLTSNPFLTLSDSNDIPLTQNLVSNEISLQYFHENRLTAIQGITKTITEVCVRALSDIMHEAMERNSAQNLAETQMLVSSLVQPGFDRMRIGEFEIRSKPPHEVTVIHPDDRTMFVTFSKGYPVGEMEIREFFTQIYGDCIESLYMQEVQVGEQSLFCRIVFYSPSFIDLILKGEGKVKFTINGKHVWMRKFVPKHRALLPPPLMLRPGVIGSSYPRSV
ncbi:hypothetical protein RHMOL_Rhmol05G0007700 [Rhododendron molle]|uniref:Uncharacterized protein n=1 Tax=Rhododendron molle TaxID=49168 RepID=A0ACC0NJ19_RHOML|nr:hypothetical protein RHMOL_Rhmol05G0007700 [Rhododendron molle]